jgi:hypothetical protein
MTPGDADAIVAILCAEDIAALSTADTLPAPADDAGDREDFAAEFARGNRDPQS